MLRRIRCRSCGSTFYTAERVDECQDCTGTRDDHEQAIRDAEALRAINSRSVNAEPQSVDPRTGEPSRPRKEKKSK